MSKRICITCGKEYSYCPTCGDSKKPSWYNICCSEICKDIYEILAFHSTKQISDEDAKKKLQSLDLVDFKFKDKYLKDEIDKLLVETETTFVVEEEKSEGIKIEEEKAENKIPVKIEPKKYMNNKSYRK